MGADDTDGPLSVPFQTDIPTLYAQTNTGATQDLVELMPASSHYKRDFRLTDQLCRGVDVTERTEPTMEFFEKELGIPRLNNIHDHLWFAGRPVPPRPLNYQVAASRAITVTEDIHLHMVWEPGRMFLKPLPRYLFSLNLWTEHLVCQQPRDNCSCFPTPGSQLGIPIVNEEIKCERRELYKCAYGLLLSYTSLIQYESDYHIARDQHLFPDSVDWQSRRKLSWELLEDSPLNTARVNKRYQFGELRVGRLNKIYRIKGLLSLGQSGLVELMRGYKFEFSTYGQQFEGLLAPVLAATVYILLVLTAMQVGLSTERLKENVSFQRASYGFTVFSVLAPLILFALVILMVLLSIIFNYQSMTTFLRSRREFYACMGH